MKKENANRVVCFIQARMGSSRLPGKVMQELCTQPMLWWVVTRAKMARLVDLVVVATTQNSTDDAIETYCQKQKISCFRGDEFDVLDRIYQAALFHSADIVVRLTADCPLIDHQLIDEVVDELLKSKLDFCTNRLPPPFERTYPIGLDVEVVTMCALKQAWENAHERYEREHVMPFFYQPGSPYQIKIMNYSQDLGSLRWTVDTPQDLIFIREVLSHLKCRTDFGWMDVLEIVQKNPHLININADVIHKQVDDVDQRAKKMDG